MNLIICITPLQVLIAKQIIKQHSTPFIGLYLPYGIHSKASPNTAIILNNLSRSAKNPPLSN